MVHPPSPFPVILAVAGAPYLGVETTVVGEMGVLVPPIRPSV